MSVCSPNWHSVHCSTDAERPLLIIFQPITPVTFVKGLFDLFTCCQEMQCSCLIFQNEICSPGRQLESSSLEVWIFTFFLSPTTKIRSVDNDSGICNLLSDMFLFQSRSTVKPSVVSKSSVKMASKCCLFILCVCISVLYEQILFFFFTSEMTLNSSVVKSVCFTQSFKSLYSVSSERACN